MQKEKARNIILEMLQGIDPVTGEVLEEDHLCFEPEVQEALEMALSALNVNRYVERYETLNGNQWIKKNGRLHAGRPWTQNDKEELKRLHESGMSINEIAVKLQRRVRGTKNQLESMALIPQQNHADIRNFKSMWSDKETAKLEQLYGWGWSISEIADVMKRSFAEVKLQLSDLGLLQRFDEKTEEMDE